ncbi:MAG: GAF domain-containing protein [Elusimicrobia bacterium]|nr:GAF domain-containing protein [Elusimicrobiota bacterium]
MLGLNHYQVLYELLLNISTTYEEHALAHLVLQKMSKAFNAGGGAIYLMRNQDSLEPVACYGIALDLIRGIEFRAGKGLIGWVVKNRASVKIADLRLDPRFSRIDDGKNGFAIRNMLAAPISLSSKIEGVIQFVNKQGGIFNDADEELLLTLGRAVGSAVEKARSYDEIEKFRLLQQAAINSLPAGVILANAQKIVLLCNEGAQKIFEGLSPRLDRGQSLQSLRELAPQILESFDRVLSMRQNIEMEESRALIAGRTKILVYSCSPVYTPAKDLMGASLLLQDITRLKKSAPGDGASGPSRAPGPGADAAELLASSLLDKPATGCGNS